MDDTLNTSVRNPEQMLKIRNLLEEIHHIEEENKLTDETMCRVSEIVQESSTIVKNSTSTSEMLIDGKILQKGAHYVGSTVSSLETNLTSFDETKYAKGILSYIKNFNQVVSAGKEWGCLGEITYKMFRKSHPLTFMLGTFTFEPPPPKEKHQKERKQTKKTEEKEKNVLSQVAAQEKPAEAETDVYDHILKCLVQMHKKNDRKPINYFKFIIDPTDYWTTIENIFHFAFLVRDGSAKMSIENNLPVIEPVLKKSDNNTQRKAYNNQFCFRLSVQEWQDCIKKFKVSFPAIPPFAAKV